MIIGIIILLIGLVSIIQIMNPDLAINFNLLWPILSLALAFYKILADKIWNTWMALWLYISFWWLLVELDLINYNYYSLFWPIMLVIIGTSLILGALSHKKELPHQSSNSLGRRNYVGILGGTEEQVQDDNFEGAEIYAILGGVDLNLKKANIQDDVVINVYSIFGGATILSPDDYNIKMHSTAILGGNENKLNRPYDKKKKTIYINCISIFGGCEIK